MNLKQNKRVIKRMAFPVFFHDFLVDNCLVAKNVSALSLASCNSHHITAGDTALISRSGKELPIFFPQNQHILPFRFFQVWINHYWSVWKVKPVDNGIICYWRNSFQLTDLYSIATWILIFLKIKINCMLLESDRLCLMWTRKRGSPSWKSGKDCQWMISRKALAVTSQ